VQDTPLRGDKKKGKGKMKKEKRKREKEKRETEIKIRLTAKEREEIRELAREEGLNVSEYIRKRALQRQAEEQAKLEMERQLVYELHRIGVNLNQMARGINILKKKGTLEGEDRKLLKSIEARVEKAIKEFEGVVKKCLST
jgi:type II secretory pathway component PulF